MHTQVFFSVGSPVAALLFAPSLDTVIGSFLKRQPWPPPEPLD